MRRERERQSGQSLVEFAIFVPILLALFLGIADFARVFATMITIESAAREAADWGAINPGYWSTADSNDAGCTGLKVYQCTVSHMEQRACTPASGLPDFEPAGGDGSTCSNPTFSCQLVQPGGGTTSCSSPTTCADNIGASTVPCKVEVDLTYTFDLIAPTELIGLSPSFTFTRTSIFAVADTPSSL